MKCKIEKTDNCQKEVIEGCEECKHNGDIIRSIKICTTKELVEELQTREGVKAIKVGTPNDEYFISTTANEWDDDIEETGPCIILIIDD